MMEHQAVSQVSLLFLVEEEKRKKQQLYIEFNSNLQLVIIYLQSLSAALSWLYPADVQNSQSPVKELCWDTNSDQASLKNMS